MKKFLSVLLVFLMNVSLFAYVPLSNTQNNLGSYQSAATSGMFYNELDIISSYPVELMDFEGTNLYTNWSNARNYNISNAFYPRALRWGGQTNNSTLSWLQLGITGNPLSLFGIKDSRAGLIFQNYGGKTNTFNFDFLGAADSEFVRENDTYALTSSTISTVMRTVGESTNVKYYMNSNNNQWNAGLALRGKMENVTAGFSIARMTNTNTLLAGGRKSYRDNFLTDAGAISAGMPASAREGTSYVVDYANNEIDQNSGSQTDLLFQGRYNLTKDLAIDGALGFRFQNTYNPGGLFNASLVPQATLEKNAITVAGKVAENYTATQFFDTGSAITNRSQLDYLVNPTLVNVSAVGIWDGNNGASLGTIDFKDERTGLGPMVNLQGKYMMNKIDITGVFNFSSVSQSISADQRNRQYIQEKQINPLTTTEIRTYTETDFNENIKSEGETKTVNIDAGAKIEFKMMETIKLALGAFIRSSNMTNDFSKILINRSENISYDDGNVANTPGTVGAGVDGIAGTPDDVLPGPAGDTFGASSGGGEGTWTQSTSREANAKTESTVTNYIVPIGMEIPVYKDKWLFRAGTVYTMQTIKTVTNSVRKYSTTSTTVTPAGATAVSNIAIDNQPLRTQTIAYTENHTTAYTYGIQWNINKNLTIAANAVLDTNINLGNDKATIFDLDTYRDLSLQAIFRF